MGFVAEEAGVPVEWTPFWPIPPRLTFAQNLVRLWHNPKWNERLFINTCAERLFENNFDNNDDFYVEEIARRLLNAIHTGQVSIPDGARFMAFRIKVIYTETLAANVMGQVIDEVFMTSSLYPLIRQGAN